MAEKSRFQAEPSDFIWPWEKAKKKKLEKKTKEMEEKLEEPGESENLARIREKEQSK